MRFVWDEHENRRNRVKHKISFEAAQLVFADPFSVSVLERVVDGEERWQTLGLIAGAVVVLVAHTAEEERGEEVIRIVSARKATPRERNIYETQGQKNNEGNR
jgi:uncharacterized DUF497 family protein